MNNTKTIANNVYSFGKISPLAQFHIVRRLAPVIGGLLAAVGPSLGKDKSQLENPTEEMMVKAFGPISEAISQLSDIEAEYVLFGLMKPVQRSISGGGWAYIISAQNTMMYEDIDMGSMLQIAVKSFLVNLGGFINALPSGLKEGATETQPQVG